VLIGAGSLMARNTDSVQLITVYHINLLHCKRFLDIRLREVVDCLVGVVVAKLRRRSRGTIQATNDSSLRAWSAGLYVITICVICQCWYL